MGNKLKKMRAKLEERIHGGPQHRATKCPCELWTVKGYRKPGSMKGKR
jgi:hypothetical protein